MKSSTDLFDLIHSLTSAEKGYFKKSAALHGSSEKKYLKLFDAINAQEEYHEEKLKKKFRHEISNFSAAKSYLFELLLDVLRDYQREYSFTSSILRLTDQADLLFKRGLIKSARDKYAEAYHKAVEIFSYKHAILPRWGYMQCCFETELDPLLPASDSISVNKKIQDEVWLEFGHSELALMKLEYMFRSGNPQTKKMLEQMQAAEAEHIQHVASKVHNSVWGKALYYERAAFYAMEQDKRILMLHHSLTAFQIFRDYPVLKKANPYQYFTMLLNLMTSYTFNIMEPEIDVIQSFIKEEVQQLKVYMDSTTIFLVEDRLFNNVVSGVVKPDRIPEAEKVFEEVLPWLEKNKRRHPVYQAGLFRLYYLSFLFLKNDFKELVFRCNEFLYEKEKAYPQAQRAIAILMYLLAYLDQGDWDILPAKLREAHRLLKEETVNNEATMLVIRLVDKVIKEKKQFELKPTLIKLKDEVEQLRIGKTSFIKVFSPFFFKEWIDSKLEGLTYPAAVQRERLITKKFRYAKFEEELKKENLTMEDIRFPLILEKTEL